MEARVARHQQLSAAFQAALAALGLSQVPVRPAVAAHTLSAPYYPAGVEGAALLSAISAAGVTVAGGLHPAIRARYFRIGHMGAVRAANILTTVRAIEEGLRDVGYAFEPGCGVAAAQRAIEG